MLLSALNNYVYPDLSDIGRGMVMRTVAGARPEEGVLFLLTTGYADGIVRVRLAIRFRIL